MKFTTWMNDLVKANSGLSSKSFFLVVVTVIGSLLLLVPVFSLTIEAIYMHTIATDLSGFAAYIGSVSSLFAAAGLTKVMSEKYEKPFDPYEYRKHKREEDKDDDVIYDD